MGRDRIRLTDLEGTKASQQAQSTQGAESQTEHQPPIALSARQNAVLRMQQTQGNAAVRRMLVQRAAAGEDGGPIDDQVTKQINGARGGGTALDSGVAQKMGDTMGHDFSGVHVHTDAQADTLNRQLSAKAFTTGSDIFFQQGAYQPGSSSGQELLAHELTHVVQQSGSSPGGSLTLGPAHDSYEQEADSVAHSAMSGAAASSAQRAPAEEELVQAKRDASLQRKGAEEEEELVQAKRDPSVQRHEDEDDHA